MTRWLAILLALALSGCATGGLRSGSWSLRISRGGQCRQIEHEAKTDQLETKTTWRGEKCQEKTEGN